MLRACVLCFLVLMPLTTAAQAEALKSFRISGLVRGKDHRIKDVAVVFATHGSLIGSSPVGITLCDEPGRNTDKYRPTIQYKMNLGTYADSYRCVSHFSGSPSIVYRVTVASTLSRDGGNYHFQGKVTVTAKGETEANEVHVEDAIIAADGPCKLVKYEQVNTKPKLAKIAPSAREPESIVTTSGSTCAWE